MLEQLIERLVEMFPRQDYQNRLDSYVRSKNPQNAGDVDHHINTYMRENTK